MRFPHHLRQLAMLATCALGAVPTARAAEPRKQLADLRSLSVLSQGGQSRIIIELSAEVPTETAVLADGEHELILPNAHVAKELARKLATSGPEGPVAAVALFDRFKDGSVHVRVALKANEGELKEEVVRHTVGSSFRVEWKLGGARTASLFGPLPEYARERVDFATKDLDLAQFLELMSELAKRPIVLADGVSGKVTVRLRNTAWEEALDAVLKSKGLGREDVGATIRIVPLSALGPSRKVEPEQPAPLKVRLVPVNYQEAANLTSQVKEFLSPRGSVVVDERTNVLIVKDTADVLPRVEQLVRKLDAQTPQFLIETRIVEATDALVSSHGVQWGAGVRMDTFANLPGPTFPNLVADAGAKVAPSMEEDCTREPTVRFPIRAPAPPSPDRDGWSLGSAGSSAPRWLAAEEASGRIKTISSPKAVTIDGQPAIFSQGVSIPYATACDHDFSDAGSGCFTTTVVEPRLSVAVTPHVTADGSVMLTVAALSNEPPPVATTAIGPPTIARRAAKARLLLQDGDMMVLRLSRAPQSPSKAQETWFAKLFHRSSAEADGTALFLFIYPRIINRPSWATTTGDGR